MAHAQILKDEDKLRGKKGKYKKDYIKKLSLGSSSNIQPTAAHKGQTAQRW